MINDFLGVSMTRRFLPSLAALMLLAAPLLVFPGASALAAPDAKLIGSFEDWNAYSFMDGKDKVCFMSAKPSATKASATIKKRGDVLLFITHWPGEKERNVVSVSIGYPFKQGSESTVSVDGKDFALSTEGETAWTKDPETDEAITAAIRKGAGLSVAGVSKRGTKTTDTYSLKGSGAAYDSISKECGAD
jgi:hypothetical protein